MDLLNEFYRRHHTPPQDVAKRVLFTIFEDITGRRGLRQEWDACDDEIKNTILETNLERINKELNPA